MILGSERLSQHSVSASAIDSLIRPVHRSTSVGLLELGRLRGVEELGDELGYSFGFVFLEEVAAVWEGGELGLGVGALDALHGFGDVG